MANKAKWKDNRTLDCSYCRHEVNHPRLGHDLRAEREMVGLSQKEVAGAMDITPPYLCELEKGRRPWTAKLVAAYLAAVNGVNKH